jgi:hypothetical protein
MRRFAPAAVLALVLAAACSETPVELPTATTLKLNVDSLRLTAGDQGFSISATVADQQERPLLPQPVVTYTSSNPVVALVSPGGFITPLTVGTATIVAQFGAVADSLPVVIEAPVLDITPATAQVVQGTSVRLTATMRGRSGRDLLVTGSLQVPLQWSAEQPAQVSLSGQGSRVLDVNFSAAGTFRVFFAAAGLVDTATVQVVNSGADLLTAVNIVQDSLPGLYSLMASSDPATLFTWTGTTAVGINRCNSIMNSGLVTVIPRNQGVATVSFISGALCQYRINPSAAGTTWVVLQVGTLRDSVFVQVVPSLASVNIIPDSIVVDQTWAVDNQQPLVEYVALDPRGNNVCTSSTIQGLLGTATRNATLSQAPTNLGTGGPAPCRLRIRNGTSAAQTGRAVVTLGQTNGATDSLFVRVTANAPQFSADVPAGQSLVTLGLVTAGDTVRAGVPRTVAVRVRDRAGAPVAGAVITWVLTTGGIAEANLGTVVPARAITDTAGLATAVWTPPTRLTPDSPNAHTQSITLTANGLAANNTAVATPAGVVSSAAVAVRPGAPARLVVFRANPGNGNDTLARITVDSNFVGQSDNSIRIRGFDANNNRVPLGTARTLLTLSRPERMGALLATATVDSSLTLTSQAFANDSGAATIAVGAATATLQLRALPTPQAVFLSAGSYRLGSLFNDLVTTSTLVSAAGAFSHGPGMTASPDTVALFERATGDGTNFRAYIRPVNGGVPAAPAAAEAISWAQSSTYWNTILGAVPAAPAFAPATADYGTAYFISDSVTVGTGVVYQRTRADSRSACVGNLNPYFAPNGLAVNGAGTRLAVTTQGRSDGGTGTDSTTFSQVQLYSLPGCTLVSTVTSNTSVNIVYRAPVFVGTTLVVERRDLGNNTTALGDIDQTTGAFTSRISASGNNQFQLSVAPSGVLAWRVTGSNGLFTAIDPAASLAPGASVANVSPFTIGRR